MREQPVASLIEDEFPGEWGDQDAGDGLREALVLRATNFIDGGIDYSSGARRFIPEVKVTRKRLQKGDLILEAAGGGPGVPVGRVARFDPPDDRLYVVSNFFRTLRPAAGTDSRFTHHLLDHLYRQPKIWEVQQQTTGIINLKVRDYLQIRVPVPPLPEQRRIAEILDTIDETIRATERVIAKLEVAHEGLRRELVPERLDDGVEQARLGDLIDPSRPIVYGILMPGDHVNGGVPVIKVKDIKGGAIADRRTLLHTSPQIDEQYARSRVREGDLLFTIRGTVGRMAFVPSTLDNANITQDTARLAIDGVNRSFLLAAMTADLFSRFVDVHTIGQAVKGINLRELRQAPVLLLPRDQQEVVGATLDDSLELVDAERRSLDKLQLLRSGVGADLLSGRVRTVAA